MAVGQRQYTADDKAAAIAMYTAQGGPDEPGALAATARALDIPDSTISEWVHGRHIDRAVTEKSDVYAREIAARLDGVVSAIVGAMADPLKIDGARYGELATAMKHSVETSRLLREKASPDATAMADAYTDALLAQARAVCTPTTNAPDEAEA